MTEQIEQIKAELLMSQQEGDHHHFRVLASQYVLALLDVAEAAQEFSEWADRVLFDVPHPTPDRVRLAKGWNGSNVRRTLAAFAQLNPQEGQ